MFLGSLCVSRVSSGVMTGGMGGRVCGMMMVEWLQDSMDFLEWCLWWLEERPQFFLHGLTDQNSDVYNDWNKNTTLPGIIGTLQYRTWNKTPLPGTTGTLQYRTLMHLEQDNRTTEKSLEWYENLESIYDDLPGTIRPPSQPPVMVKEKSLEYWMKHGTHRARKNNNAELEQWSCMIEEDTGIIQLRTRSHTHNWNERTNSR